METHKKVVLILLLLVILTTSLFAQESNFYHIISYYTINVDGKSDANMIKSMIVPPGGDPPFSSVDALEKSLESKKRVLMNMRVFEDVEYEYEALHADDESIRYRVKFFIKDAFTFLAIPYPKYDSNYGFRLGVKGYDRNLFGKFADLYFVINTTQIDNSWKDYEWYGEVEVTDIPLWKTTLNLYFDADTIQHGLEFNDFRYKGKINWKDISLLTSKIDLSFDIEAEQHDLELGKIEWTGNFAWRNIPLDHTNIDLNVKLFEEADGDVLIDRLLTMNLLWKNLPVFGSNLSIKPLVQLELDKTEYEEHGIERWIADYTSINAVLRPFRINGEDYTLSHTTKLKFPHEYLQFTTSLALAGGKLFNLPFSFSVSSDNYYDLNRERYKDNTYAFNTGLTILLPFSIVYKPSFGLSFRDGFDLDPIELEHVPLLSTTQSVSFSHVNWKGNLRSGIEGTITGKADYALFTTDFNRYDYLSYQIETDMKAFLKLGGRVQLSSRIVGFYSHMPSSNWYRDQHFPTYLPSSEQNAISYIRGILDRNFYATVGSGKYQKVGAVANFDATLLFIKFPKLGEGFVSLFSDIGIFTHTSDTNNDIAQSDLILLKTVGIEGYGILKKYPSYPIRASLGLNLDDIIGHFNGDIGFRDIEFVLTIGMGLHY